MTGENGHLGGYTELEEYTRSTIDYEKLRDTAKILTYNLNNIIDYNYYPIQETENSESFAQTSRYRCTGII